MASDLFIKRFKSKTFVRKLFQSLSSFGSAVCLAIVPYLSADVNIFLLLMVFSMLFIGLQSGGIIALPTDLTTEFSATVFTILYLPAITNGFVCPWIIGWILDLNRAHAQHQWLIIWLLTAALQMAGGLAFVIWGSSQKQNWDA